MLTNGFIKCFGQVSYINRGVKGFNPTSTRMQSLSRPNIRFYSNEPKKTYFELLDEIVAEKERQNAQLKSTTISDPKEELRRYKEHLSESYKQYYSEVAGPGTTWKDQYPREFYQLPAERQALIKEMDEARENAMLSVISKYGRTFAPGLGRITAYSSSLDGVQREPVRVAVTGAAGAIGYAITYRIASGGVFGPRTPVILHLLELPQALNSLKGVEMELLDCAFPTLKDIVITDQSEKAFEGVDYALLIGSQPRTAGMERGDLLLKNAEIFATQGRALDKVGKGENTRVFVVGNPANTNAMIASHHAKTIPPKNFIAMTRLDHNRGLAKLAEKTKSSVNDISRFVIWGNHSATQYPDISHAFIKNKLASELVDKTWYEKDFIPGVQQRGAEIIKARGSSSAASAASSAIDGIHDWHFGTATEWTSSAVQSSGEYGVTQGLFYSYPVVFNHLREWDIVKNLPINEFSAEKMEATHKELLQERDGVSKYLSL